MKKAREWYLAQEKMIPKMINRSASLRRQVKQAFKLRNEDRIRARELMADRDLAMQLDQIDPNLSGREIINSSQRYRMGVNEKLGVNRWLK